MGFLYVLPGKGQADMARPINWRAHGLDHVFDSDNVPSKTWTAEGPDGQPAILLSSKGDDTKLLYRPDEQKWLKSREGWSCGYWLNSGAPTAESLERPVMLNGRRIKIGGEEWLVPVAMSFYEFSGTIAHYITLSREFSTDEQGEPSLGGVEEEFEPLLDIALQCWQEFYIANVPPEDRINAPENLKVRNRIEMAQDAIRALQFNYRISWVEACLKRINTFRASEAISEIVFDKEECLTLGKKLQPSQPNQDSNTNVGETVEADPPPQPSPT